MALEDDIALFASHPLLGALEHEALRLVAFSAERRSFRAGDILARRGESAETAFLILSGALALDLRDDGSPAASVVGAGALVDELALFAETARHATIMAREPVAVLVLRREVMLRVLNEFPASAQAVHAEISARLRDFSSSISKVRTRLDMIQG